jgi:histone-lysine N-methyltransferase SETMAR
VDTSFADPGTEDREGHNLNRNVTDSSKQEPTNFARIIAGDQSWFFLEYFRNHVWRLGEDNIPEWVLQKMDTEKHMFTIFWSTIRLMIEKCLQEHDRFDSTYFCDVIIPRLTSAVFPDQGRWHKQQVYVHMDIAKPHNSKRSVQCISDNNFKRIPHPPYSPHIAPSDLYLFGTVKQRLQTCQGCSLEELQENVYQILGSIELTELAGAMRAWIARL